MKKVFSVVAICCLVVTAAVVFTGCAVDVTGDQVYSLDTDEGDSEGTYMSYKLSGTEDKICTELLTVSERMDVSHPTFKANGSRKSIDKKMKAAVNKAMDAVEADSTYCKPLDFSGLTVKLTRISGDGQEEVFSRTFKARENK